MRKKESNTDTCNSILARLENSKFRAGFKLKEKDRLYFDAKGYDEVKKHAFDIVRKRVVPAFPENDGKQTPMKNHPVFIAQHATATCCQGCIEKWHGIPKGRELTENEIDFIVNLIMAWIVRQTGVEGF